MNVGSRVRWDGQVGVVLELDDSGMAQISLPGGLRTVALEELEPWSDDPEGRLLAGTLDRPEQYALRMQAEYLRHAFRFDPLAGLSNARVEPKHHQVYVAHRVARKPLPRMILADEVGLGKTIEAGLVLKEMAARGHANRVLVATPANLRTQWQKELQTKFNMDFTVVDGDAARHFGRDGSNPFERLDRVVCSLPFISREPRSSQVLDVPWDLVVFDEAHRVRAGKSSVTKAYELAEQLRHRVQGLLLLTATPLQLSVHELWALIDLVEPGLYPSPSHYDRERRRLPRLNELMGRLQKWATLDAEEQDAVRQDLEARSRTVQGLPPVEQLDDPTVREAALDAVAQEHPLADVLVRNRRQDVGGFTQRTAKRVLVELSDEEQQVHEAVEAYLRESYALADGGSNAIGFLLVTYQKMLTSSSVAIHTSLRRRHARLEQQLRATNPAATSAPRRVGEDRRDALEVEDGIDGFDELRATRMQLATELEVLGGLIEQLAHVRDSKARVLVELLESVLDQDPTTKVLVFTQFLQTQRLLTVALEARGHEVASFNGRLSSTDKDRAVEHFRRRARVMVSTEAGGEGRNLQFSHVLVNYDLPWNPMRVEQRIGRVDRIGQTRPVVIYNLANAGTIEERVLEVLQDRIRLFEESVGSLDPILGTVEQDLEQLALLAGPDRDQGIRALGEDVERRVREAMDKERTLRDFALERNSFRRDETNRLLQVRAMATHDELRSFVQDALRYFGGNLAPEIDGRDTVTLSPALATRIPGAAAVHRGTFVPDQAVREEDWDFFAMGHPLVDALLDEAVSGTTGVAGYRHAPDAPVGGGLELLYALEVSNVSQQGRLVHHVVDESLHVERQQLQQLPDLSGAHGVEAPPAVPSWSRDAVRASTQAAHAELRQMRASALDQLGDDREERRRRLRRVHEHKVRLKQRTIDNVEQTIQELLQGDDAEQQRIIPALRGRVRVAREDIAALDQQLERDLAELDTLEPRVSLQLLQVGVVVP